MQGNMSVSSSVAGVLPEGQVPRVRQIEPPRDGSCGVGKLAIATCALACRTLAGAALGASSGAMMGLMVKGGDMMLDRMFGDAGVEFPIREGVMGGAAIMAVIVGGTSFLKNLCDDSSSEDTGEVSDIEMQVTPELLRSMADRLEASGQR